mmetsp:Transcript_159546/g.511953  ORF Transcript_159546/g.511953 Transcript_159546/m.511953 type:complete len:229 (-) Transcript_159546:685-1371(-)
MARCEPSRADSRSWRRLTSRTWSGVLHVLAPPRPLPSHATRTSCSNSSNRTSIRLMSPERARFALMRRSRREPSCTVNCVTTPWPSPPERPSSPDAPCAATLGSEGGPSRLRAPPPPGGAFSRSFSSRANRASNASRRAPNCTVNCTTAPWPSPPERPSSPEAPFETVFGSKGGASRLRAPPPPPGGAFSRSSSSRAIRASNASLPRLSSRLALSRPSKSWQTCAANS